MNLIRKRTDKSISFLLEFIPIEVLFVLFWNIALISSYTDKSNLVLVIIGTILINGLFLYTVISIFLYKKFSFDIRKWIRDNFIFLAICGIYILCYLTVIDAWLNLDGYIYYQSIREMKNWKFASFSQLMLAGHSSQGYSIFLLIGEFLMPDNVYGVRIIHCIMALITIYCFYQIVSAVLYHPDKSDKFLLTSLFAFSPMVMGMTAEINTDFPLLCFFTWMVCCGLKEKKILQTFCGLLLCFSKETGCLLYGFYIFGIILYRFIKYRKEPLKTMLPHIFSMDIWLLTAAGIIWMIHFVWLAVYHSAGWGTTLAAGMNNTAAGTAGHKINSIGIYSYYIFNKVKQMLYVNFNWILFYIILVCLYLLITKGFKIFEKSVKPNAEIYLGVLFSLCGFVIYNMIYITYNHYRYLLPFAFFISFGAVISLVVVFNHKKIRKLVSAILVLILFVSNFYTFDPFSQIFFMKQGTGTGDMLITCTLSDDLESNVSMADNTEYQRATINGNVYNMQYAYLGKCFDKTLEKIDYTEDTLIIMPCEYRDDEYGMLATIFGINVTGIDEFYWDTQKKETNINCAADIRKMSSDKRYQKINMRMVHSIDEIPKKELNKYSKIYYIALPFDKSYDHIKFLGKKQYKVVGEIQYAGWKWNLYQIMNTAKSKKG